MSASDRAAPAAPATSAESVLPLVPEVAAVPCSAEPVNEMSQAERARLARLKAPRPWPYYCEFCGKCVNLTGEKDVAIRAHLIRLHNLKYECVFCSKECTSRAEAEECEARHKLLAEDPSDVS